MPAKTPEWPFLGSNPASEPFILFELWKLTQDA